MIENLLSEATVAGDIGLTTQFLAPLLYKVYTKSLVSQIADIQPLTGPYAKVFALIASYGGRDSDNLSKDNSIILGLSTIGTFAIDGTLSTATGNGTIVYIENNYCLVKINSGTFTVGQPTIQNAGITIISATSNRNYAKKVFSNYSGPYTTAIGEAKVPNNLDYEVIGKTIEVVTRKLKSKLSKETIQDVKAIFGKDLVNDIVAEEMASEMIQEMDKEVIDFLKSKADIKSDLVLSNSYGTQNDLASVGNDIYANIYKLAQEIITETKRKRNFFILADEATIGLLMASPLHIKSEEDKDNSYYMGKLGSLYSLYLDPFATSGYALVGYKNNNEGLGDAGLIFAPYANTI